MKVEIISNGKTRNFLSPERAMDEAALADLGKQPVEFLVINKQVQLLDKTFPSGVILQSKIRDTPVSSSSAISEGFLNGTDEIPLTLNETEKIPTTETEKQ